MPKIIWLKSRSSVIPVWPEDWICLLSGQFFAGLRLATRNEMPPVLDPFRFVLLSVAGWMNQYQRQMIDYLREENRVLREQLRIRRLQLNDDQGQRLAARAKGLGRKLLVEVASIVTRETLLAWHRKLMAPRYDGSVQRPPGRVGNPRFCEASEAAHRMRQGVSERVRSRNNRQSIPGRFV